MASMKTVLGQSRAIKTLQSALQSDRLHHAYIFHGPAGVGKFTTARHFAAVLLCRDPQIDLAGQTIACGSCASCRRLNSDEEISSSSESHQAHPDLHVVTKELARFSDDAAVRGRKLTTIPVTVLRRSLMDPVYRSPQLGDKKVFILDEAHLLNDTGQNLLLKTLEQPPSGTYLILVTDSHDKLLPTIRSRCQHVAFVPLPEAVVREWLDQQAPDLGEAQRRWLIGFVAGSLGRARLVIDYELFDWAQTVVPALDQMVQDRFPSDLGQQMAQMIDCFAKQWVDRHDGASKEAANRHGAGLMWSLIGQSARQKMAELSMRYATSHQEALAHRLDPWLAVIDALESTHRELWANVNIGLVTDHLVSLLFRSLSGTDISVAVTS